MSSPYPVLDDRPIDQWKVTELKEELRRRKLTIKGLKEDLIKRLDEALRNEREIANEDVDNGFNCDPQHEVQARDAETAPAVAETAKDIMDHGENQNKKVDDDNIRVDIDDSAMVFVQGNAQEGTIMGGTDSARTEEVLVVHTTTVETSITTTVETSITVSESVVSEIALSGQESQNNESQEDNGDSKPQLENEDSKPPHKDVMLDSSVSINQVSEVSPVLGFQVKSDSISTDSVSITEKNELKDNIIADNVKLELDVVKPEMVEPSSSNVVPDGGESHPMDVDGPLENKVSVEEKDENNAKILEMSKKNDNADVGYSEKLNLDRSSGDDSMEEDALESKQIDSKYISDEVGDRSEQTEVPVVNEEVPVDVVGDDLSTDKKEVHVENKKRAAPTEKRKLHDQEAVGNNEPLKRQRRWNSESLKVPEPQSSTITVSTTPKDTFQSATLKRNFSRSDSTISDDTPKERAVPPSPKSPTTSLRIDRFLRPFTLKAVQELLGKTGSVTSFWMDHIKTHCYVTYSSVEEAIETRNAVYNLQWPPNGGRLLVAEFVGPEEVKMRVEAPQSPATPVSAGPTAPPAPPISQLQPSPRQQVLRQQQQQQLPPAPPLLQPLPPLSNLPPVRERLPLPLPPPPPLPLPEKLDPPIVTLDDLFRKTKATPRIYYLPLSEEQVATKRVALGQNTKQ